MVLGDAIKSRICGIGLFTELDKIIGFRGC